MKPDGICTQRYDCPKQDCPMHTYQAERATVIVPCQTSKTKRCQLKETP